MGHRPPSAGAQGAGTKLRPAGMVHANRGARGQRGVLAGRGTEMVVSDRPAGRRRGSTEQSARMTDFRRSSQPGPEVSDLSATSSARIADQMRRDIAQRVFAPGERLRIAELAARYGTSHLPVREALRVVEGQGLVEIAPHKGSIVRPITAEFVDNILDLRVIVETYMMERSVERISAEQIEQVSRRNAEFVEAAATGDIWKIIEAHGRLHEAMFEPGGNPEAMRFLRSGFELIVAIRIAAGYTKARLQEMCDEHAMIIEAMKRRDAEAAAQLVRQHGRAAQRQLVRQLKEREANEASSQPVPG